MPAPTRDRSPRLDLTMRLGCRLVWEVPAPVATVVNLQPPSGPGQRIRVQRLLLPPGSSPRAFRDVDGNHLHHLEMQPGENAFVFDALVAVPSAREHDRPFALAEPVGALPPELLRYTLPSRYVDSDELMDFAFQLFGSLPRGREQVQAVTDWVHTNVEYRTGSGSATRTARETIDGRFGVCRDFAHALVALCRCLNYPARYVSGYVPEIGCLDPGTPNDYHAYAEVFHGGRWHTWDARFNWSRIGRVKISHGLDAVDTAFATIYGAAMLRYFEVWSYQVDPDDPVATSLDAPIDLTRRLCGTPEVRIPRSTRRLLATVNGA